MSSRNLGNECIAANFPELENETVFAEFGCSYSKPMLLAKKGTLLLTTNHLIFIPAHQQKSANDRIKIEITNIREVQKANWIGMIPNSIIVCEGRFQHFFTSIEKRDERFKLISEWLKPIVQRDPALRHSVDTISFSSSQQICNEENTCGKLVQVLDTQYSINFSDFLVQFDWHHNSLYARFIQSTGRFSSIFYFKILIFQTQNVSHGVIKVP